MIESKKQTSRENARYSNKILRQGLRRVMIFRMSCARRSTYLFCKRSHLKYSLLVASHDGNLPCRTETHNKCEHSMAIRSLEISIYSFFFCFSKIHSYPNSVNCQLSEYKSIFFKTIIIY